MGVTLLEQKDQEQTIPNSFVTVQSPIPADLKPVTIETKPYPGFPTDLQAQFMALLTMVPGISTIQENIFENRLMHVAELRRMGADLKVDGMTVTIQGKQALQNAELMATDLRASASLVLAALATKGESLINRVYHLDRGYYQMDEKLRACGAQIKRLSSNDMMQSSVNEECKNAESIASELGQ